jgi:hypothetical protein
VHEWSVSPHDVGIIFGPVLSGSEGTTDDSLLQHGPLHNCVQQKVWSGHEHEWSILLHDVGVVFGSEINGFEDVDDNMLVQHD